MTEMIQSKPAEAAIRQANESVRGRFPFDDTQDMDDARRGFMGTARDGKIMGADGRVVWDLDAYGFLSQDCPATANPSLWRQSRLTADHGLFEVVEGVYQIRGFDLSNMTVVEASAGFS